MIGEAEVVVRGKVETARAGVDAVEALSMALRGLLAQTVEDPVVRGGGAGGDGDGRGCGHGRPPAAATIAVPICATSALVAM